MKVTKIQIFTIIIFLLYVIYEFVFVSNWRETLPESDPIIPADLIFIYPILGILAIVSIAELLKRKNTSAIVLAFSVLSILGCKENSKNASEEIDMEKEANESTENTTEQLSFSEGDVLCFAEKNESAATKGNFNFEFIQLKIEGSNRVSGVFYSSPYGIDGSRGNLKGIWDDEKKRFDLTATFYAEGEEFEDQRTYTMKNDELDLGFQGADGDQAMLAKVDCAEYDKLFSEYSKQNLQNSLNTTDRKRVNKILNSMNTGYSEEHMQKVRFMEAQVELNNDPGSSEYLVYIMDPMVCGSGGCDLYILDSEENIVSEMSVTRPPIYIPVNTIDDQRASQGEWNTIYVYSEGMRKMEAKNGKYPKNPSVEMEIAEEQIQNFPNQYRLVMDYLD